MASDYPLSCAEPCFETTIMVKVRPEDAEPPPLIERDRPSTWGAF
jgi:hypothetical protein